MGLRFVSPDLLLTTWHCDAPRHMGLRFVSPSTPELKIHQIKNGVLKNNHLPNPDTARYAKISNPMNKKIHIKRLFIHSHPQVLTNS